MIYLIHGADTFRSKEKLNELISEFRKKGQNAANLDIFDMDDENVTNKIKAAAQTLGFLSVSRMIVVKNIFGEGAAAEQKDIKDYVIGSAKQKNLPEFIFYESKEILKKNKEFAGLGKQGTVFSFPPLSPVELRKWVSGRFAELKTKITPGALDKLILYVGNDLWRLSSEIEKLSLLKSGEKESVADEDIEAMVKSDLSTSIFTTVDALARRDKKMALKLLADHFEKGEAPIYIFSMFSYQFSNLIRIKTVLLRQASERRSQSAEEVASILKMHPYVAKKAIPYAAKFSLDYLKKVYKRLLRLDFLIKKGRLDAEVALEMIVVEVGNLL